jgi:hypothetical protein
VARASTANCAKTRNHCGLTGPHNPQNERTRQAQDLCEGASEPGSNQEVINVRSYNKTILPCHAPIAGALQKPADLSLRVDLEHKKATTVPRHEPAAGTQPFRTERAINPRESLRAEICFIKGHPVVRLSRLKRTAAGREKRTGSCLEFGAHRCGVIASLLSDVMRELGGVPNGAA